MDYFPQIEDAKSVRHYELSGYRAVLLTDIRAIGYVDYAPVLLVAGPESDAPIIAVAAEVNSAPFSSPDSSHVLGFFPGDGHENLGFGDQWADLPTFEARALSLAAEHLGLQGQWSPAR